MNDSLEKFKKLFEYDENFDIIIQYYEESEFENFDHFCTYIIQDYFNFLELEKNISEDKKKVIREFFK